MAEVTPLIQSWFPLDTSDVPKQAFRTWGEQIQGNVRDKLTASRTYFVRTDGNNANTGLTDTAGGALLTVQEAVNRILQLDCNGFIPVISVGTGTYTGTIVVNRRPVGGSRIQIQNSPAAVPVFAFTSGYGAFTINGGEVLLQGIQISNSGAAGQGIFVSDAASLLIGPGTIFGACPNRAHIEALSGGRVQRLNNYTISGAAPNHILLSNQAIFTASGGTITITGTPNFSTSFIIAQQGATAVLFNTTWSGAATGVRYRATGNAVIDVFGAGVSHLPGDVAGVLTTGGQYL